MFGERNILGVGEKFCGSRGTSCTFVILFFCATFLSCLFSRNLYADYIINYGEIVDYEHPLSDIINDVEFRLSSSFATGLSIRTENPDRLLLVESNGGYPDTRSINIVFERGNSASCPSDSTPLAINSALCQLVAPVADLSTRGNRGEYASSPRAVSFITEGEEPLTYGLPDTDDGRLNFAAGDIIHIPSKLFVEAGLFSTYLSFFSRFLLTLDPVLYDSHTYRRSTPRGTGLSDPAFLAYKEVGFGMEFLDLYAIIDIPFLEDWDASFSLRIGRFGISWGTSLLLPFNLNFISPIDVASALQPGLDLRDLRKPVEAIQLQGSLPFGLSFDAFYQLRFRPLEFPATGTPISTSDLFHGGSDSRGNLGGQSFSDLSGGRNGDPYAGGMYRRNCSADNQHPLSFEDPQGVLLINRIRSNAFSAPCSVDYIDNDNPTSGYDSSLHFIDNDYVDYRVKIRTGYLEKTRSEAADISIVGRRSTKFPAPMTQGGISLHFSGGSSPFYYIPVLESTDISLHFANYHSREPFPSSYFDRNDSRALSLRFGTAAGLTTPLKYRIVPRELGPCSVASLYFPRIVVEQSYESSGEIGCRGLANLEVFVPNFYLSDLASIFSYLITNYQGITQAIPADLPRAREALGRLNGVDANNTDIINIIANRSTSSIQIPRGISSKYLPVFPGLYDLSRATILSLATKFANIDVLSILTQRTVDLINKLEPQEMASLIQFIPENSILSSLKASATPEQVEQFLIRYLGQQYPGLSSRQSYLIPGETLRGNIFADLALVLAALQTQCLPYDEQGQKLPNECQHYLANGAEVFQVIPQTSVFFEYPENIQMVGASFSTVIFGVNIFGEFIWRRGQPFVLELEDLVIEITKSRTPLYGRTDMIAASIGVLALAGSTNPVIKFLGAAEGILIFEAGTLFFPTLLRSGTQQQKEKSFSTRYAMRLSIEYPGLFGTNIIMSPNIIWMHDPYGTAPIPELYQEGNYSLASTIDFSWPNSLKVSISYTHRGYYGNNSPAPISDRDSFSFGISYAF